MLTRSRIQKGEGKLEEFNPEIGKRRTFPKMSIAGMEVPDEISEQEFRRAFLEMKAKVDILFQERQEWKEREDKKGKHHGDDDKQ